MVDKRKKDPRTGLVITPLNELVVIGRGATSLQTKQIENIHRLIKAGDVPGAIREIRVFLPRSVREATQDRIESRCRLRHNRLMPDKKELAFYVRAFKRQIQH